MCKKRRQYNWLQKQECRAVSSLPSCFLCYSYATCTLKWGAQLTVFKRLLHTCGITSLHHCLPTTKRLMFSIGTFSYKYCQESIQLLPPQLSVSLLSCQLAIVCAGLKLGPKIQMAYFHSKLLLSCTQQPMVRHSVEVFQRYVWKLQQFAKCYKDGLSSAKKSPTYDCSITYSTGQKKVPITPP